MLSTRSFQLSSLLIVIVFTGCSIKEKGDPAYINSINQWHIKRMEGFKKLNSWLNLAGLYWLEKGDNKFGSASDNQIVFPHDMPEYMGIITVNDSSIRLKVNAGVAILSDSINLQETILKDDLSGSPTIMQWKDFKWFIIKRGDKYGIRLRDLGSDAVRDFKGVDRYPVDSSWRITAVFKAYDGIKIITIPNIIGSTEEDTVKGELQFSIDGKEYKLVPVSEGEDFFIIFADETNGDETYGAGRFLYAEKPDASGKVIIDFNKAYNPPCAFTKYATCPLPPKENYLHLKVAAGEKKYGKDH